MPGKNGTLYAWFFGWAKNGLFGMRHITLSLRVRLILLVLIAVIPAFALISYTAISQRRQAVAESERNARGLIRLTVEEQDELIAATRQLLMSLAQLPAVRSAGSGGECSRTLARLLAAYPYYTNLGVAAADGRIDCSARPMRQPVRINDRGYFRRAMRVRDFAVGDYQTGRITGLPAINFGYPLLEPGGRVQGVVFAGLNLSWIKKLLSGSGLPSGSILAVIDGRGTILAHQPDRIPLVGRSMVTPAYVSALSAGSQEHFVKIADADGVTRLYLFAPLHRGPSGTVYVSVGIPEAAVLAAARRDFARGLILFALVAALALIGAWIGGEALVLRRVQALANAARRLGKGDFGTRTGLPHGQEELGELARGFDDMAAALERVNRALKVLSAGNRVVVRAADEEMLLAQMCRIIVEVGGYRLAWSGYAEQTEQCAVRAVAQAGFEGGLKALSETLGAITWRDADRGHGPAGTAIRTAKPYVTRQLATEPGFAPWREEASRRGYAACAAFPLPVQDRVIGVLAIYAAENDAFDTQELSLLAEMAEDLAFGMGVLRTRAAHDAAHETIRRMAHYDRLTGLPNHAYLEDFLQHLITEAPEQPLALLLLGIDRLSEINAALGFDQGDRLIRNFGMRLADHCRGDEVVARMRGDEFAVLLPGGDVAHAMRAARELIGVLAPPFEVGDLHLDITATVGIALYPQHGADAVRLVRHADLAMHQGKETGTHYTVYAPNSDEESPRRLALASELRQAIDKDELVLHYQPKIDLGSGQVCGAEALVRWLHPREGLIPPDSFIPLAEHTGLIKPMTDWVLAAALRQLSIWRQAGPHLPIAVNLSVRNLRDPDLIERVAGLLRAWSIDPGKLEVEITESAMMDDPKRALEALVRLRDLGIRLFIDDFGTGHSSLAYLKRLPVDAVKIDKSFVSDMLSSTDSEAIVRSTITLAHDIGLKVVAEGIEDQATWERLVALGCDTGQGYFISKPLECPQFETWLDVWPGARKTEKSPSQARRKTARSPGRRGE